MKQTILTVVVTVVTTLAVQNVVKVQEAKAGDGWSESLCTSLTNLVTNLDDNQKRMPQEGAEPGTPNWTAINTGLMWDFANYVHAGHC